MNNKLTTLLSGVLLLSGSVLQAQDTSSAYDFLDISTSTHAYTLGSTNVAIVDPDVTLVDQNPALLGPEVDNQVAFNYMHYMGSGNFAGLRVIAVIVSSRVFFVKVEYYCTRRCTVP